MQHAQTKVVENDSKVVTSENTLTELPLSKIVGLAHQKGFHTILSANRVLDECSILNLNKLVYRMNLET